MTDVSVSASVLRISSGGQVGRGLEFLPLMHQIADLPHQRLVAVDDGLGRGAVVIEAGGGHGLFDIADLLLGRGDPGLEILDSRAACLLSA